MLHITTIIMNHIKEHLQFLIGFYVPTNNVPDQGPSPVPGILYEGSWNDTFVKA